MNRDLYHPLTIGAIIIWIIMAFSINIPIFLLCIIYSFSVTLYFYFNFKRYQYILIIVLSVIVGTLGIKNVELLDSTHYLPFKNGLLVGDIKILTDSAPIRGGLINGGSIFSISNGQIKADAVREITLFTKKEFYKGQVLKDIKIKSKNGSFSASITENHKREFCSSLYKIRSNILQLVKSHIKSNLLIALITGNKCGLSLEEINSFRVCGCSHILALSGFHVGIITILLLMFLRFFFTGDLTLIIAAFVLTLYLSIVGVTPSLLRSVLMFMISIGFKIKGYKISIYSVLIISFYVIIIILPKEFYTLSFKLSYLALFGILTLSEEIGLLPGLLFVPKFIKLPFTASIAAMLTTSMISITTFGTLYPAGICASVIISPIITLFMWIGLLSIIIPSLVYITSFLEDSIYKLLSIFSNIPVIDKSNMNFDLVPLIIIIITVILLLLKLYRRVNARRFNLKFKL